MFLPSNITLKFGDTGDFVAELQRRLALIGQFSADAVNGFYDGSTVAAVTAFQGISGLHADGVAGPETLRRLNGVIAGDSGSAPTDKKEEDPRILASHQDQVNALYGHAPVADIPVWGAAPESTPATETLLAIEPTPTPEPTPSAPTPPTVPQDLVAREPTARENLPSPDNSLAAMLMGALTPPEREPDPSPFAREPIPMSPVAHEPGAPHVAIPRDRTLPPAPPPEPLAVARESEPVPERSAPAAEPAGIVGKTMRFANAMVQKIASYMEAKLPANVLAEVQSIGLVMAKNGLKEAPLPTGPEIAPLRDQQLPDRAPATAPAPQRGA